MTMCYLCDGIRKNPPATAGQRKAVLEEIAGASAKKGAEHFKPLLDELLGTAEPKGDAEVDEAWENRYRRGD